MNILRLLNMNKIHSVKPFKANKATKNKYNIVQLMEDAGGSSVVNVEVAVGEGVGNPN